MAIAENVVGGGTIKPFAGTPEGVKLTVAPNDLVHVTITQAKLGPGEPDISGYLSGTVKLQNLGNGVYTLSDKAKFIGSDMSKIVFHAGDNPETYSCLTMFSCNIQDMTTGVTLAGTGPPPAYYNPTLISIAVEPTPGLISISHWL